MEQIDEETNEERTIRYAKNRYELRMEKKWRLNDTAEDDMRVAKEMIREELKRSDNV